MYDRSAGLSINSGIFDTVLQIGSMMRYIWEYLSMDQSVMSGRWPPRGRTDEHERVGHVVVTHVDDRRADPAPDAPLGTVENSVHHSRGLRRSLDSVQALAGVAKTVWNVF